MTFVQQQNHVARSKDSYLGRFAPSPTGPLHFGSLITAVASYCDAKSNQGQWFVRIEDTDIIFQKDRLDIYEHVMEQLHQQHLVYACQCKRKMLGSNHIYMGTCRDLALPFQNQAIRLKVSNQIICFDDILQGQHCANLQDNLGDFVLKRRDGIINYQLAVVVDDFLQGITHVIRGSDLLDNTERQIWLGMCLGYPTPQYMHLPLAMNDRGGKLSKQNHAEALNIQYAPQLLTQALSALGQPAVDIDQPYKMLIQAVSQWDRALIPKGTEMNGIYQ